MCSETVVSVKNLSKCFQIYDSPRDRLKQFLFPRFSSSEKKYFREFWALKDLSFDIKRGETIGIIGRNGAGKSTLLQIICGTLSASSGNVVVHGRIAALLELGAGFNPDFTGRENVYLNGSVLGLSKTEIDNRFEEIEKFADIGDFIDQPVKSYSSGMYVRLAFSVQACVDPEILIVDEALSVGDIGFQYKCFKRMEQLKKQGVTIIMVTHSTGSILEYADRCIVVDGGKIIIDTEDVLAAVLAYEKGMLKSQVAIEIESKTNSKDNIHSNTDLKKLQQSEQNKDFNEKRFGTARAIIRKLDIIKSDGSYFNESPVIRCGEEITFRMEVTSSEDIDDVILGISLSKAQGGDVWGDNNLNASQPLHLKIGTQVFEYLVKLPISPGEYLVHCGLSCNARGEREELDQRRPMEQIKFWSARNQVGVVFAPIKVLQGVEK
ncbi:lipopolysaccharide transport system ATP-binding protein [Pseudomonas sp. ok272]|uniref:ABC transporter ATP-binding protein n=1 Tax=unclassified Pseudomonas TaxID=196821 RepID=UPI0008BF97B0|nr:MULTISPECIES: ABC transporter ATP-binding protein [unclassified Pseudomonas]SEN06275.1 lipopolysaccharide transport system ATP-binding protein [Pseudomonas sp. ok272]SFN00210.1 lipopolysaccharide transport system ATP-binding protein [Pseudomonas sp. ok602]